MDGLLLYRFTYAPSDHLNHFDNEKSYIESIVILKWMTANNNCCSCWTYIAAHFDFILTIHIHTFGVIYDPGWPNIFRQWFWWLEDTTTTIKRVNMLRTLHCIRAVKHLAIWCTCVRSCVCVFFFVPLFSFTLSMSLKNGLNIRNNVW